MSREFVHLHVHSDSSLLDGLPSPKEIVQKAKQLGHRAVAITDHGNLLAVPDFYIEAKNADIKPIIGIEFYYANDISDRQDKDIYHLLCLAKNNQGLENIYILSTISYLQGFYYKPRIDRNLLLKYKEGLIITTGCVASIIPRLIQQDRLFEAEQMFRFFLDNWGGDFYVEIQDHGLRAQQKVNKVLLDWAQKYNVKIIATNDVHYCNKEDADIHDALLAIQTGARLSDEKRFRFVDDNNKLLPEFYMKTYEDYVSIPVFREHPESLYNTLEVAEKCGVEIDFSGKPKYPVFADNAGKMLRTKVETRAREKKIYQREGAMERLQYELDVIERMGFASYFLIVSDLVEHAKQKGIMVGPGRGSAAGSLVAYILGITAINPLDYNLLFERFLNPDRVSPPDIDLDFDAEKRDDVIAYIREKYGEDRVAHIVTYSVMGVKAALKDALRICEVSAQEANKLTSLLDKNYDDWDDIEKDNTALPFIQAINSNETYKKSANIAKKLVGKTRQISVHASGIVVAPCEIHKIVPLARVQSAASDTPVNVTQYDMRTLEKLGLLKIDVLGLNTLSIINKTVKLISKKYGENIDIYNIDTHNSKAWELLHRGDTKGVFQFEGDGITQVLKKLKPTSIEELAAVNALYRPGPMEQIDSYIRRKNGLEPITYPHDSVKDILSNTYGIIVYQEQIMQILQRLASFTLAEADLFRRAIGKKIPEIIQENKNKFIQGCMNNRLSEQKANELFYLIEKFSDYGFNKSHAVSYAYLAYVCAYLKANYPIEFYLSMFNSHLEDYEEIAKIYNEAKKITEIRNPDINFSDNHFYENNGIIYHGLYAIRNIRRDVVDSIIKERKENGIFLSLEDFIERCAAKIDIDKRTIEALIYSGALDELCKKSGYSIEQIRHEENINLLVSAVKKAREAQKQNIATLFDLLSSDHNSNIPKVVLSDKKVDQQFTVRKYIEYVGYSTDALGIDNPSVSSIIERTRTYVNLSEIVETYENVKGVGIIRTVKKKISKNKKNYIQLDIEDKAGKFSALLFDSEQELYEGDLCFLWCRKPNADSSFIIDKIFIVRSNKDIDNLVEYEKIKQSNNVKWNNDLQNRNNIKHNLTSQTNIQQNYDQNGKLKNNEDKISLEEIHKFLQENEHLVMKSIEEFDLPQQEIWFIKGVIYMFLANQANHSEIEWVKNNYAYIKKFVS